MLGLGVESLNVFNANYLSSGATWSLTLVVPKHVEFSTRIQLPPHPLTPTHRGDPGDLS
jgi:hypothetical protein